MNKIEVLEVLDKVQKYVDYAKSSLECVPDYKYKQTFDRIAWDINRCFSFIRRKCSDNIDTYKKNFRKIIITKDGKNEKLKYEQYLTLEEFLYDTYQLIDEKDATPEELDIAASENQNKVKTTEEMTEKDIKEFIQMINTFAKTFFKNNNLEMDLDKLKKITDIWTSTYSIETLENKIEAEKQTEPITTKDITDFLQLLSNQTNYWLQQNNKDNAIISINEGIKKWQTWAKW